ncbi:nucleotidyltransferase domain-containing protein [Paenibacillus sp. RC67]|uniref:nucleotidyltransferase domain-containing protein n=1 Tax=Paenibacillus sp. RC67 TaxID=3039392 RepID=UPI0024ACCE50|nr:nucleotidyltransferase domain-containing protein [Paenibacillus sp. RC67]
MVQSDSSITSIIKEFLEQDLSTRSNVETIVLCGSYATGKAGDHSDVDLCYIGAFANFRRESLFYNGRESQLMIAPWSWYEHVVNEYERKGTNIATITVMLSTGQCIKGDNEKWRNLQSIAIDSYHNGPTPLSADEIRKIRVRITDLWEDFCDKRDHLERIWLSIEILQKCVEAQFTIQKWWAVKTKYVLEELRTCDALMANLVERCLKSPGSGPELEIICTYVLEPIGGWMKESWKE